MSPGSNRAEALDRVVGEVGCGAVSLEQLAAFGRRIAVVARDGSVVTHEALARRARELADELGAPRRLIAVVPSSSMDAIALLLGAVASGHVVALASGGATLASIVDHYDPDVVVDTRSGAVVIEHRHDDVVHELNPQLALLMATSGSTGSPKLVRLSHANLRSNAHAIAQFLGLGDSDRAALTLPLHYCYGLSVLHSHLAVGGSVMIPHGSVVDPCFWDTFTAANVTTLAGVPHTFELLDRSGFEHRELPSLRRVTQAGGKLAPDVARRHAELARVRGWDFFVMYGQTEATARMAYLPPHLVADHPEAVGVPIPGGAIDIEPVTCDGIASALEVGEIVYRGPNVMLGYATDRADLARGRTVEALRTGDLGRWGADGLLEIVGRVSRIAKIAGERIDLDRVESLLTAAGIAATVVASDTDVLVAVRCDPGEDKADEVGLPDDSGSDVLAESVHTVLRGQFAFPPRRIRVVSVAELPLTPSGKIDHRALLDQHTAKRGHAEPVVGRPGDPPRGGIARAARTNRDAGARRFSVPARGQGAASPQVAHVADVADVAGVFERAMGITGLSGHETYAGLGGDSLGYVELSTELEGRFGVLPTNWHLMTIAELARALPRQAQRDSLATDIVLRAVAIVLVVATHAGVVDVKGGAHFLLALAGYNFARFVVARSFDAGLVQRVLVNARRLMGPTAVFAVATMVERGDSDPAKLLFVHNYAVGGRWRYWFVEVLVQILGVCAVSFACPWVRRRAATAPFAFSATTLGVTAVISMMTRVLPVSSVWTLTHNAAWLFAFGWAVEHSANRRQRVALSLAGALTLVGYFGDWERELAVFGGLMLLVWLPRVVVPRVVIPCVASVGAASFAIYLTHFDVLRVLHSRELPPLVILAAAIAFGAAGDHLARCFCRAARGFAARLSVPQPDPAEGVGTSREPISIGVASARIR